MCAPCSLLLSYLCRCGVDSAADAVDLGRLVSSFDSLQLLGIQAYHGGLQHVRQPNDRAARVGKVRDWLP